MLRYVPALLSLALTVYCVIDAFQTPEADVRNLPKIAWVIVVLLFPVIGPVAWLLAGRPTRASYAASSARRDQTWEDQRREQERRRPRGPDDDPDFLKDL